MGVIGLIAIIYLIGQEKMNTQVQVNGTDLSSWQQDYKVQAAKEISNYQSSTGDTEYYDINDPVINTIAKDISSRAKDSKAAISLAAKYVYDNVEYTSSESDSKCYSGDAPAILKSGSGQCDTQSITVISLLRAMGIAAKPVGGCIVVNSQCRLESFFLFALQGVGSAPKFTTLSVAPDQTTFSRGGVLHAWVTAWVPDEGWVTIEATNGKIVNNNCYKYFVELFPADNQKSDICISKNRNYAEACALSDVNGLNKYGLGVAPEVHP